MIQTLRVHHFSIGLDVQLGFLGFALGPRRARTDPNVRSYLRGTFAVQRVAPITRSYTRLSPHRWLAGRFHFNEQETLNQSNGSYLVELVPPERKKVSERDPGSNPGPHFYAVGLGHKVECHTNIEPSSRLMAMPSLVVAPRTSLAGFLFRITALPHTK